MKTVQLLFQLLVSSLLAPVTYSPDSQPSKPVALVAEKTFSGRIESTSAKSLDGVRFADFEYLAETSGTVTVTFESFDFDGAIRVDSEDGSTIAEDDNGDVGTNDRVSFDAHSGARYSIRAIVKDVGAGEFGVTVRIGVPARSTGAAFADASIEFHRVAAARAHGRNDTRHEAPHRLILGWHLLNRSQFTESTRETEQALNIARLARDDRTQAAALALIGTAERALGNLDRAEAALEESAAISHRIHEVLIEANALSVLAQCLQFRGQYDRVREVRKTVLALYREAGDELGACDILIGLAQDFTHDLLFSRARLILRRALAVAREAGHDRLEAYALWALGNNYDGGGLLRPALTCFSKELEIALELGDRGYELSACGGLGHVYERLGDIPQAREWFSRQFTVASGLGAWNQSEVAATNLGRLSEFVGNFNDALSSYSKALEMARQSGERINEAILQVRLGQVLAQLDKHVIARHHIREGVRISSEIGDPSLRRFAIQAFASLEYERGALTAAHTTSNCLLALAERANDLSAQAAAYGILGNVFVETGAIAAAARAFERAQALWSAAGDPRGETIAIQGLGRVCVASGDFVSAKSRFEEALRLARSTGDRLNEGIAQARLGTCLRALGDYAGSSETLKIALRIAEDLENPSLCASAASALGWTYSRLGEWKDAAQLFHRAVRDSHDSRYARGKCWALVGLASARAGAGDLELARAYGNAALRAAKQGNDLMSEACALDAIAHIALEQRELSTARDAAEKTISLLEPTEAARDKLAAQFILARVAIAQGDAALARSCVDRARQLFRGAMISDDEHRSSRSYWAKWSEVGQDLAWLVASTSATGSEHDRAIADGFKDAGLWKSHALLAGIMEHWTGGRSREASAVRRRAREAKAARDSILEAIAKAIRWGRPSPEVTSLRAKSDSLLATINELSDELRTVSPKDAELQMPTGVDAARVQATLDDRTVLIEFTEGQDAVFAYAVTRSGLSMFKLGAKSEITVDCNFFASRLSSLATSVEDAILLDSGSRLYDSLLKPVLAQAGPAVTRIIIVPTDALARIPFDALPIPDPHGRTAASVCHQVFVIDRYEVCVAPSSPVLVQLCGMGHRGSSPKALVLADPLYPSEATAMAFSQPSPLRGDEYRSVPATKRLDRLPGTRAEAQRLASRMVEPGSIERERLDAVLASRSGAFNSDTCNVYVGADASPAPLEGDLREYSILHISGHGYIDDRVPDRTGLALAPTADGNAWLTMRNVLDMDLDADLVFLSACETARGEGIAGEGVQSLARAFMFAGARGVIASLWQVEDSATSELVGAFYEAALTGRQSYAASLRHAKLAIRCSGQRGINSSATWSHPSYWAGFVYIGAND